MQVHRFIRTLSATVYVLLSGLLLSSLGGSWVRAQSIPQVPFDIEFAGVSVHLTESGRQRVQRELSALYGDRDSLRRDVALLQQVTPLIEPLLEDAQLPGDYRYAILPFAGADVGYWALTGEQGTALGLRIDRAIDERYHPILATEAAVNQLKNLQATAKNYVRTLLDYLRDGQPTNRPPTRTDPTYFLLDGQNNPAVIWKILARKLAYQQQQPLNRPADPYMLYVYEPGDGQSIRSIAQQLSLNEERFTPFNQWLRQETIDDGKAHPVLIRVLMSEYPDVKGRATKPKNGASARPSDIGFPVLTKLATKKIFPQLSAVYYQINDLPGVQAQPSDNVVTLAYAGNIAPKLFLKYNDLDERDLIQPGQIYYLASKATRAKVPFHVVQRNQTLREIAHIYGVQLKSLLDYNDVLATQRVQPGRIIWLQRKRPRGQPVEYQPLPADETPAMPVQSRPAIAATPTKPAKVDTPTISTEAPESKPITELRDALKSSPEAIELNVALSDKSNNEVRERYKLHVVRPGQTYYTISKLYNVTVQQLYNWNNLSETIPLKVGQQVIVDFGPGRDRPGRDKPSRAEPSRIGSGGARSSGAKPARQVTYHIVEKGQTIYRVALINQVTVSDLMRWNNLSDYAIEVGQKLILWK